jgi:hypothetical protein
MKALLKRALRPLIHKFEGRLSRLIKEAVLPVIAAELERSIRPSLDSTRAEVSDSCNRTEDDIAYLRRSTQENILLLDSLVRELVRVQTTLEALEPGAQVEAESETERLMIG